MLFVDNIVLIEKHTIELMIGWRDGDKLWSPKGLGWEHQNKVLEC